MTSETRPDSPGKMKSEYFKSERYTSYAIHLLGKLHVLPTRKISADDEQGNFNEVTRVIYCGILNETFARKSSTWNHHTRLTCDLRGRVTHNSREESNFDPLLVDEEDEGSVDDELDGVAGRSTSGADEGGRSCSYGALLVHLHLSLHTTCSSYHNTHIFI